MTFDNEVTLIRQIFKADSTGNQIPEEERAIVLCGKKSVMRSEFYSAAVAGKKPELIIVVHGYEYSGEKEIEFDGDRYSVIRDYAMDFEEIELVCEMKLANVKQEEGGFDGGD